MEVNSQSSLANVLNPSSLEGLGMKSIKNNTGPLQMSNNESKCLSTWVMKFSVYCISFFILFAETYSSASVSSGDSVLLTLPMKRPETMAGKGAMQMPEVAPRNFSSKFWIYLIQRFCNAYLLLLPAQVQLCIQIHKNKQI